MNIQIVVPTRGCINNCPFCCSKMHDNSMYETVYNAVEVEKRIKYVLMHNTDTCVLTGTGEVLQNKLFLRNLLGVFDKLNHPFPNVEIQTTGVMLDDKSISLLKTLRVNTISLSISSLFNDDENFNIIGVPKKYRFDLKDLITYLKTNGFNVRLSINMLKNLDNIEPSHIFKYSKLLGADQITFKKMYFNNDDAYEQNEWIKNNMCSEKTINNIKNFIIENGRHMYTLNFGSKVYSVKGLSTVVVDDCMAVNNTDLIRYFILRENCKLYCHWDDEGSLIF